MPFSRRFHNRTYQIGHGNSTYIGGKMCYFPSVDKLVADCVQVVKTAVFEVAQNTGKEGLPVFLFGQSFGGAVSTRTAIENADLFAGLILTSPMIGVPLNCLLKCLSPVAGCASCCCPFFPIADAVHPSQMSSDPAEQKAYADDPKVWHDKIRGRVANECKQSMLLIQAHAVDIGMPVVCVLGDGDQVVEIAAAQRLIEGPAGGSCTVSSEDKTFKLFEGLWHTLFHEPRRQEIVDYVAGWINARV